MHSTLLVNYSTFTLMTKLMGHLQISNSSAMGSLTRRTRRRGLFVEAKGSFYYFVQRK